MSNGTSRFPFHRQTGGLSFLMLVVLVSALGIAIGVAMALGARHLDAQRTAETRHLLPEAFRAVFPLPAGSPGADLRTDFGYLPDAPTAFLRSGDQTRAWDLRALVDRTAVGTSQAAFGTPPPAFDGTNAGSAWNGPYWKGTLDGSNRPVDAWGRLLELRSVVNPSAGWILHSAGANGVDDTAPDSGTAGGDDLVFPSPPYVPLPTTAPTFEAQLNLSIVLRASSSCGHPGNNIYITAVLTYQDAAGTQSLTVADDVQLHRNGKGKPNRTDILNLGVSLRVSPGGGGLLQLAVTGGCPDTLISSDDFDDPSSGLAYLGSSTSGDTTTYSFSVTYVAPPAVAAPWPITLRP